MNDFDAVDREVEIGRLRKNILVLTMKYLADAFERSDGTISPYMAQFDNAVKALVAKLNEPEKCYNCGGEMPND